MDENGFVVGLNEGHNGGCAIIHNNRIIAISEERLNRKKNSEGYLYALNYCMNTFDAKITDLDIFAFSNYGKRLPDGYKGQLSPYVHDKVFINVDHHMSHACCAYYLSKFDKALVVVIDGQGNGNDTESYYIGDGNSLFKIGGNNANRSKYKGIGRTYETFTNFCGWSAQQAGKTMGLSAYGKSKYNDIKLYDINDNLEISSRCEGKYIEGAINFVKTKKLKLGKCGAGYGCRDAARYVQQQTEEVIIELINKLYSKYKIDKLCLAGGVFLNGVINQKILEETPITEIFVPPCCDDTGQAIGNALYAYHNYYKIPKRIDFFKPYLAREYTEDEVLDVLEKKQEKFILPYEVKQKEILFKKSNNIASDTAKLLSEGKIIGWFQGESEIGPRALGNRSILCAPFPYKMKDILNKKIKHREKFRPFAPAVLMEKVTDYFVNIDESMYMLKVCNSTKCAKNKIPATLNKDGKGRVQTVSREINSLFYDLINEFYKITGIPALLNTSFNDNNEPIVESPKDAMVMFCKSQLDYLIINDYIISKR